MYTPRISFIIPCYNHAEYLSDCLNSLIAQTVPQWEAIVVDDASTRGNPTQIVESLREPRIRCLRHASNLGPAAALNTGFRSTFGSYVVPMGADDRVAPEYAGKVIAFLDAHPTHDCVFSYFQQFGVRKQLVKYVPGDTPSMLTRQWLPGGGTTMRRELWMRVGGYCESNELIGNEDWDFYLGAAEIGFSAGHIPEPLYLYRKHTESLSTRDGACSHRMRLLMYERHQWLFDHYGLGSRFIADGYLISILAALRRSDLGAAVRLTEEAVRLPALHGRVVAWVLAVQALAYAASRASRGLRRLARRFCRALYVSMTRLAYLTDSGTTLFWDLKARRTEGLQGCPERDLDALGSIMHSIHPSRLLDVGCGTGRLFPLFQSAGVVEVFGQDISPTALRLARQRHPRRRVQLLGQPVDRLAFPDRYFDLVVSHRVMQHIKERQLAQVLSAVCRMGKYVYIGERTESDSPCCFKHDYRALFARQGFEELRAGTTAGQSWLLFGRHDDAASLTGVRPSA